MKVEKETPLKQTKGMEIDQLTTETRGKKKVR